MKTKDLIFKYPPELVAQKPAHPRDSAKLLVLNKKTGKIQHSSFKNIGEFLKEGDVLVFNETKVFPARIFAKKENNKTVEVLFLEESSPKKWLVLIGGRVKDGEVIKFPKGMSGVVKKSGRETFLLFSKTKKDILSYLNENGKVPLPPYIKRSATKKDKTEYQTVFAKKEGSAAAPTAGLHFTRPLLQKLKKMGVEIEFITLHVGLGTFEPIKTKKVEEHPIHTEYFEINKDTAQRLVRAKKENRRIIAVGTTVVRALESTGLESVTKRMGKTDIFIYPGYRFKMIDGLITNFHTPQSSLLALVFAFAGKSKIKKAYRAAIKKRYRLFSYGDGMFIK